MISENRLIIYLCIYSLILVTIDLSYNYAYGQYDECLDQYDPYCYDENLDPIVQKANGQNFESMPKTPDLAEDQIITCVKDVSDTNNRNSLICHIFTIDDLDWYQEIQENNYGLIGDLNDSFELGLID